VVLEAENIINNHKKKMWRKSRDLVKSKSSAVLRKRLYVIKVGKIIDMIKIMVGIQQLENYQRYIRQKNNNSSKRI
jgi:hypothetical protein